ncbi:MAG: flagellar protein FlaG [Halioglobus sp.]
MIDIGIVSSNNITMTPKVVNAVEKTAAAPEKQRQDVPLSGKVSPQEADSDANELETLQAIEKISEFTQSVSRDLEFKVDVNSGTSIVTVRDRATDEVIRQMPSEEAVAMAKFIAEQAPDSTVGLFMDQES